MSPNWRRVLLTIARETPESRVTTAEEEYVGQELVFDAINLERADHQVRLIIRYATKLGFTVRAERRRIQRLRPE